MVDNQPVKPFFFEDINTITIAPNYAITESLGAIIEYSDINRDAANTDSDLIALELTYTF